MQGVEGYKSLTVYPDTRRRPLVGFGVGRRHRRRRRRRRGVSFCLQFGQVQVDLFAYITVCLCVSVQVQVFVLIFHGECIVFVSTGELKSMTEEQTTGGAIVGWPAGFR